MNRKRKNSSGLILLVALVLTVAIGLGVGFSGVMGGNDIIASSGPQSSSVPETPKEPYLVAEATVGSTGDLLIHAPIISGAKQSDGSYDFGEIFSASKEQFEKYDLMVANLEVTLAGDKRAYTGYPAFNSPDSLINAAVSGGVDMLLTANNHSYDTSFSGMTRTMQVLKEKKVPFIGTRESAQAKPYTVMNVNGIKIGMVCYTYSTTTDGGNKALNGIPLNTEAGGLVNTFDYGKLDEFYADAQKVIADMKKDGAEATMIYVHWGEEYDLTPNSRDKQMAQKICDMGYDVIVGGHPHVVQPMEILKGADGNETICLYSMGNAVSNQRRERMDIKSGHTEDGVILEVTFEKYSDGKVNIKDCSITPTWVDMTSDDGKRLYRIIPLDISKADLWQDMMWSNVKKAKESYNRTMKLVGEGLNEYRLSHGMSEIPTMIE